MAEMNGKNGNGMTNGNGNMNQCHGGMCGCGGCGCGRSCGFGWGIVRVIIALLILAFVFSFGVLVGTLRGLIADYSMNRYSSMRMENMSGGMMPMHMSNGTSTTTTGQ